MSAYHSQNALQIAENEVLKPSMNLHEGFQVRETPDNIIKPRTLNNKYEKQNVGMTMRILVQESLLIACLAFLWWLCAGAHRVVNINAVSTLAVAVNPT